MTEALLERDKNAAILEQMRSRSQGGISSVVAESPHEKGVEDVNESRRSSAHSERVLSGRATGLPHNKTESVPVIRTPDFALLSD
jgi:hypothetical protein